MLPPLPLLRTTTKDNNSNNNEQQQQQQLDRMMTQLLFLRRGHALSLVMIFAMSVGMLGAWLHLELAYMIPSTTTPADDSFTTTFVPARGRLDHQDDDAPPQVVVVVQTTTTGGKLIEDDDPPHAADPSALSSSSSSSSSSATITSATTDDAVFVQLDDWVSQPPEERGSTNSMFLKKEQEDEQLSDHRPPAAASLSLVICTRVRNEAPYLREWIEYHRMIGFESFLIMNDASTDDTQCILDYYAKQGVVVRVPQDFLLDDDVTIDVRHQGAVFDACVEYLARTLNAQQMDSTWLLTHDVDEFVWFDKNNSKTFKDAIHLLTKRHENAVQSLRIPRLLFGSSGHDYYQPGVPAIERYTYRFDAASCPPPRNKKRQEQQLHQERRRLFNHQRPTSYCIASEKKLYDDHKSMTVMSAIARDCWDGRTDPKTNEKRAARCTGPHNHELKNLTGGPTKLSKTSANDSRYLDALDILDTVAIMHYMTRSRQEFFQRTCGSQFAQKYFACRGCTPETYFNLTETYANLLQDTRMHFMAQKLQQVMSLTTTNNKSSLPTSECYEMPPPTKPWDQYRKCWFDS